MFFLKNNKKQGKDATVSSEELIGKSVKETDKETTVTTALSVHPDWDLPKEKEYVFRFLNNECPPLKPNQISLSGIEINIGPNGDLYVTAFIRNSLKQAIQLEKTSLILVDHQERTIGRKEFDLSVVGDIPGESSRPWNFIFHASEIDINTIPEDGWKLAFELKKEHQLDLAKSWEKSLSEQDKDKLQELLKTIDPPKPGEVNFMGLQAKLVDKGDLHVTMLIRNGSHKNIKIEKLPLIIEDAAGDIVAEGGFTLDNLEVKANTSKPWSFIFPQKIIQKAKPDLSKWRAYPPKQ